MDLGGVLVHRVDEVGCAARDVNLLSDGQRLVLLVLFDCLGRLRVGEVRASATWISWFVWFCKALAVVWVLDCSVVLLIDVGLSLNLRLRHVSFWDEKANNGSIIDVLGNFDLLFTARNFLDSYAVADLDASWHVDHLDLVRNTFGAEDNGTLGNTIAKNHAHDR